MDNFTEMLGGEVQQMGIVFDFARLAVVFDHEVAEAVEYLYMAVRRPQHILLTTVVIEKLVTHGELRQQHLMAVGQLSVSMVGNDVELVNDGK